MSIPSLLYTLIWLFRHAAPLFCIGLCTPKKQTEFKKDVLLPLNGNNVLFPLYGPQSELAAGFGNAEKNFRRIVLRKFFSAYIMLVHCNSAKLPQYLAFPVYPS